LATSHSLLPTPSGDPENDGTNPSMAKLQDSLNYSKFEFVDSDDEDYVDRKILSHVMNPKATSTSIRNTAAHAMFAQNGQVPNNDKIGENISAARSGMEQQLKELNEQMKAFDKQKKKLEAVNSPEEAMNFFKESGMTEAQLMDMMQKAKGETNEEQDEMVEAVVGNAEKVAAEMEKIKRDIVGGKEKGGGFDEVKKSKKKIVISEDSDDSSEEDDDIDKPEVKINIVTPEFEVEDFAGGEKITVRMPGVEGIEHLTLAINNLCLIVEETISAPKSKKEKFYLKADFKKTVDEDKTRAKWRRKNDELSVKVFYA